MLNSADIIHNRPDFPAQHGAPKQLVQRSLPTDFWTVLFLFVHMPLGLILEQSSLLSTLHALAVFVLGARWAIKGHLEKVALVAAYVVGAEVLWRMTGARVFWEFGKYAVGALFLLALMRERRRTYTALPLLYFLLLLPAAAFNIDLGRLNDMRQTISFNLSGPFVLMVSVWFFSTLRLSEVSQRKLWYTLSAPLLSVLTIIILTLNSVDNIYFGRSSSALLSGGFGPNQVSNMLGIGAVAVFTIIIRQGTARWVRILLGGLLLAFLAFSALTFSRGGFYTAVGSILIYSLLLLRNRGSRLRIFVLYCLLLIAANFFVLPQLDSFTGGALMTRFQEPGTTGRIEILLSDLIAFQENWLTGTGLDGSKPYHALLFRYSSSHVEFSRLLAEHGLFGLGALSIMGILAARHYFGAQVVQQRATVAALIVWSVLFMLQAGMRLAAPSFFFGLAALYSQAESLHAESDQLDAPDA